jgi:YhgE/Pip-like protein
MKNAMKAYFTKGQTILAIVVALMAQIIFIVCWMTAYDGVYDRSKHLKIAIINEDGEFGKTIVEQLKSSLPFEITTPPKQEAMEDLELRKVHLVITIPEKFGEDLKAPGTKATITYTLNESNPQVTKSIMESVVTKLSYELNQNAALQGTTVVFEQFKMPAEQANQMAQGILKKVEANIQPLNPVNGMHNQMVPMMLVLGSYVGAMLMAMNVHQVSMAVGSSVSKWGHFGVRTFIIVSGALLISIIGSSLIYALDGQMESGFLTFWSFHFLTLLTFMFVAQMFLLVFGMAGMFVNMAMLSLQLVTSGTIVPREMLSDFYQSLGQYLPATYAVDGLFNLGFGGIHTQQDVKILLLILACSMVIGLALIFVKKQNNAEAVDDGQYKEAVAN